MQKSKTNAETPLTYFTCLSAIAGDARAVEVVHEVLARAAVLANDALAFVYVCSNIHIRSKR